jgi:hypothetical protein
VNRLTLLSQSGTPIRQWFINTSHDTNFWAKVQGKIIRKTLEQHTIFLFPSRPRNGYNIQDD